MGQYISKGEVYVDNRLLAAATGLTFTLMNNDQQVVTMQLGADGFSDGATTASIEIESAIPRKGLEADFVDHVLKRKDMVVAIKVGPKKLRFPGRFTQTNLSQGATSVSSITGTFTAGEPKVTG